LVKIILHSKSSWHNCGKTKSHSHDLKFSIICAKELIVNHKISAVKSQGLKGSIAYFIGLGAFDKNNKPRG
jgi:hypothetical protein